MPDIPINLALDPVGNQAEPGRFGSLPAILEHYGRTVPDRPALLAPCHAPLTYGVLLDRVEAAVGLLREFGIGRDDRVAVVAPNGIGSALATVTTASAAICTPLNPHLTADEFRRYYAEIEFAAVLACVGEEHPGQTVARELGIAVVEASMTPSGGWTVRLNAGKRRRVPGHPAPNRPAKPTDNAFILLTSGTTSRPKLVPATHAASCRSASNVGASLSLRPNDRLLNMMPLFHAHGLFSGVLAALAAGSSVVCTAGFEADRFFDWLDEFEPSWYTAVPTIHGAMLAAASRRGHRSLDCSLRLVRSASSSLPLDVLTALETLFGVPVIETYGMTEAASQIAANPLFARKLNSVGVSAGAEIAIVDAEGRPLPPDQCGEVALRGPTITRGYPNDPAATASAFRDGWFRTGDLGTLDCDGYLFILGRLKDLINRGGQNIAPVEIEQVLLCHAAVAEVAVFPAPHPRLGEEVAAAVVLRPGARTGVRALQAFARTRLARFKVPRRIQIVADIPKTSIGKINRSVLAGALGMTDEAPRAMAPPRSTLEADLVALWSEVLACEPFGIDQDVFALGAESLAAVQMLSRVRSLFGVDLSFEDLLDAPTVAVLASRIRRRKRRVVPAATAPATAPGYLNGDRTAPLSFQQQRTLMLGRLDPVGSTYHVLDVARLTGPLDAEKLAAGVAALCARHEILRTTIREDPNAPVQIVGPAGPRLERVDLGDVPARARASTIRRDALALVDRGFDFERDKPLRLRLLRLGSDDHALLVVFHHVATDGWSHQLFWAELRALYLAALEKGPSRLAPAGLQYRDYVAWQQRWMRTTAAEAQRRYWRNQLNGLTALPLRADRPASSQRSGRGARSPVRFSLALTRRIKSFSREQHVTPFMTLLAVFQIVLHRHTLHHDIAVSSVLANRTRVDFEPLFGMLANTVILRTNFSDDLSVETLLQRVRRVTLDAFRHGELPIEEVLRGVRFPDGADRRAPFRSMFILQQRGDGARTRPGLAWPTAQATAGNLTLHLVDVDPGTAHEDLLLELCEDDERLGGWLEYNADLFDAATARRMVAHLRMALEGMLLDPRQAVSRLPLVPEEERQLLLGWGRGRVRTKDRGSFVGSFVAQAEASPEAVAISFGPARWSYRRLAQRSREIAAGLREHGVGRDTIVVLLAERGPEFLAAMVGVQWAGAAFLPLDPAYPLSRLVQVIGQSAASVVLTDAGLTAMLSEAWGGQLACRPRFLDMRELAPFAPPPFAGPADPAPSSLAYVVFTSGSTGTPKGAMIEQRGLLNHLLSKVEDLPLSAADVVAQTAPQSFDISVWQFLAPLLAGARVHICADADVRNSAALVGTIAREGVTVLQVVPALLRALLEEAEDDGRRRALSRLRVLLVTGEAVAPDLVRDWLLRLPAVPVINAYGPAECADDVATHAMTAPPDPFNAVPIGRPIANTRLYVLDAHGALVPAGVAGELHVAGVGVGRGYLNDAERTRERFLPDRFATHPGKRLYCTGDLARWRGDGTLEFLGRADDQLKLRGYRIEPGEIERRLLEYPEITACAVLLQQDAGCEARLVAHVVAVAGRSPSAERLRAFLNERLPFYMIPAAFVRQERLPLTQHGKLDRKALAASATPLPADRDDIRSPNTPSEQLVASIWAELIGPGPVYASANFFDLGGHSLMAGKVLARIAQACGAAPSLRAFFAAPTVEGLARAVDAARLAAAPAHAEAAAQERKRDTALPAVVQYSVLRSEWALPGLPQFNLPFAYRLQGRLDVAALELSVSALMDRHESLRTGFTECDNSARVAPAGTLPAPLAVEDLAVGVSIASATARRLLLEKAAVRVEQEAWTAFAIERPPLFRVRLLRLGVDDHVLVLVLHHVIVDGWSIGLLMGELTAAYASLAAGRVATWTAPAPAFSAFARWQRDWLATPAAARQREDWRKTMRGAGRVLGRPFDSAGNLVTGAVENAPVELPTALVAKLSTLSRAEGVTLFSTLLAGFKALLSARLGGTDVCVTTAMANRPELWMERIVGPLANTAVVRSQLAGGLRFRTVLGRVSGAVVSAFSTQQLPFELLAPLLHKEEGMDANALIQAAFIIRGTAELLELAGVAVEPFGAAYLQGQPVLPLDRTWITVSLKAAGSGFVGACNCKVGPLPPGVARRWADDYRTVLERVAADPRSMLRDLLPP